MTTTLVLLTLALLVALFALRLRHRSQQPQPRQPLACVAVSGSGANAIWVAFTTGKPELYLHYGGGAWATEAGEPPDPTVAVLLDETRELYRTETPNPASHNVRHVVDATTLEGAYHWCYYEDGNDPTGTPDHIDLDSEVDPVEHPLPVAVARLLPDVVVRADGTYSSPPAPRPE